MLLYFKTKNFRSFEQEVEFSMIAADYGEMFLENTIPLSEYGVSVLKSSVIYGANASGKSNLLKAMIEGRKIILESPRKLLDEPLFHSYNKTRDSNKHLPTLYVFGILIDSIHFEYRFSNTSERIFEETLIEYQNDSAKLHFCRKYNDDGQYAYQFSPEFDTEASEFVKKVAKKNNLFLSMTANISETWDSQSIRVAVQIYKWFEENLRYSLNLFRPGTIDFRESLQLMYQDAEKKDLFLKHLEQADFLVKDIIIEAEERRERPTRFLAHTYHEGMNSEGQSGLIEYDFLKDESTGTQQFIAWLAPVFSALQKGQTLLIDELGNSMHPLLTKYLIQIFHQSGSPAQLIFTSHDVKLMQIANLRTDQIWIIDRDLHGNSTAEPLSNYNIADDKLWDNLYLHGSLHGIPQFLLEK